MSRLATSFVLGYHGCSRELADRIVGGETALIHSKRDFDWLGAGGYFWESDPHRALEWAQWKVGRGEYTEAAIIGAAIDLGNCLDLTNRTNLELVRGAHTAFVAQQEKAGLPIPKNKSARDDPNEDRILRFLDCAVFQQLHSAIDESIARGSSLQPFDTVRGIFTEGEPLYEGCGFRERTHVQIAVREDKSIIGFFKPLRV